MEPNLLKFFSRGNLKMFNKLFVLPGKILKGKAGIFYLHLFGIMNAGQDDGGRETSFGNY